MRDAFGPDGRVRSASERHDVCSGSIYTWRRKAMSGELAGICKLPEPAFAEVQISGPRALPVPASSLVPGVIGIKLPSGIRVTVDAAVYVDTLSRLIGALAR